MYATCPSSLGFGVEGLSCSNFLASTIAPRRSDLHTLGSKMRAIGTYLELQGW